MSDEAQASCHGLLRQKVTYDSQIAYDYEKTVKVDKNVWGKETGRRETIKEDLLAKIVKAYTEDKKEMVMGIYYTQFVTQ